jgi:hypothetical protein
VASRFVARIFIVMVTAEFGPNAIEQVTKIVLDRSERSRPHNFMLGNRPLTVTSVPNACAICIPAKASGWAEVTVGQSGR